jgi:dethiobiotin synthetase
MNVSSMSETARPGGLFITGTDTGVGKTFVAALIAASLAKAGVRVGVYKPAMSGVARVDDPLGDAALLWQAAGKPGELQRVCPQVFAAPLAPHLAARAEGREIDAQLLRAGVEYWRKRSEFVLVEGAGGLMSPMGDDEYVADLAADLGYPLVVVAANKLGVINQTLQTLITAAAYGDGLPVAGVMLCDVEAASSSDVSRASNFGELSARCVPPILAHVRHGDLEFASPVDWQAVARAAANEA